MRAGLPGRRQRGVAVLTAILIVTVATALAVNILWQTSVDLQRTENLLLQEQGRIYALAAEDAARLLMEQVFREEEPDTIYTREDFERITIAFEAEGGGTITATLDEVQGRFNLNNLVDPRTGQRVNAMADFFERLVSLAVGLVPPELAEQDPRGCSRDAQALTDAVVDWIDPDDLPGLSGAEEGVYTRLVPPYRPANFWFTSTSELLAVNCFTPALVDILEPYVVALPPRLDGAPHPLNVNTARPLTLAALSPGGAPPMDLAAATGAPFENLEDDFFTSYPEVPEALRASGLSIGGNWFLLRVSASVGTTQVTMYSLLERRGAVVVARLRSFGAS